MDYTFIPTLQNKKPIKYYEIALKTWNKYIKFCINFKTGNIEECLLKDTSVHKYWDILWSQSVNWLDHVLFFDMNLIGVINKVILICFVTKQIIFSL